MRKKNQKTRALKVESLEKRELMAADVTASVVNGQLNIRGTEGADLVDVRSFNGVTRVQSLRGRSWNTILTTSDSSYTSVSANMLNGNDRINLALGNRLNINQINVDMGRGAGELVDVVVGNAKSVNVNTDLSVGSKVDLISSVVDNVMVNFGKDNANDTLYILRSSIGTLRSNMGGGIDRLDIRGTSIQRAEVDMGSGNDRFDLWTSSSQIASGFVDGGSGNDRDFWDVRKKGNGGGVQVRGFEW